MKAIWLVLGGLTLVLASGPLTEAAQWSGRIIRLLPDSAFAVVETTADGTIVRHLPHHDARGDLDIPHLCSALARWGQVKWVDARNADIAKRHLEMHLKEVGRAACRPAQKEGRREHGDALFGEGVGGITPSPAAGL